MSHAAEHAAGGCCCSCSWDCSSCRHYKHQLSIGQYRMPLKACPCQVSSVHCRVPGQAAFDGGYLTGQWPQHDCDRSEVCCGLLTAGQYSLDGHTWVLIGDIAFTGWRQVLVCLAEWHPGPNVSSRVQRFGFFLHPCWVDPPGRNDGLGSCSGCGWEGAACDFASQGAGKRVMLTAQHRHWVVARFACGYQGLVAIYHFMTAAAWRLG